MSKYSISMDSVSKKFKKKFALQNINFKLEHHEVLGVIGSNNSGKSVLLHLLMGHYKPTEGDIRIFNHSPNLIPKHRQEKIFYLSEYNTFPPVSIGNIVKITKEAYPKWKSNLEKYIKEKYKIDYCDNIANQSLGTVNKVKILLALCSNADLILLDEPTIGLDYNSRSLFFDELLNQFIDKENQTLVIITHYLNEISSILSKILVLDEGKQAAYEDIINAAKNYYSVSIPSINRNDFIERMGKFILQEDTVLNQSVFKTKGLSKSQIKEFFSHSVVKKLSLHEIINEIIKERGDSQKAEILKETINDKNTKKMNGGVS